MLDIIAAIFVTAAFTTVVGTVVGLSPASTGKRLAAFAAAAAWLAIIVAVAAFGWLAPGVLGLVPANLLPFTGLLVMLFGGWLLIPQFRGALLAAPLPVLVGLNAVRLGGLFFLLLYADGRLSAPFAPSAGLGDMITGAFALPLAAMLAFGLNVRRTWLSLWNAFGAFDLVVAIFLGVLSAPGTAFRVFTEGPGTLAMTTVPWVFVPAMLVPIFLLIHFAIAARLRTAAQSGRPAIVHPGTAHHA
jgi:hypothetical protein